MKQGLLTDRQKEVLRYRKKGGLTQQQIAEIIHTSKANVCTIEKAAIENISRARETLEFLYTLDAIHLCTLKSGLDLLKAPELIYAEAEKQGLKVKYDTISLINRLRDANPPERFSGRQVREMLRSISTKTAISTSGDMVSWARTRAPCGSGSPPAGACLAPTCHERSQCSPSFISPPPAQSGEPVPRLRRWNGLCKIPNEPITRFISHFK